jgi:hypothetical protein
MASHWSFGHMQPTLWAKEGPGVKLAIWLPTTKSRESTSSRHPIWECDMALERSRQGLQLWFRLCCDRTLQSGVMAVQSSGTPTGTISGLHFGSPKNLCHLDVGSKASCRVNRLQGREATTPSVIRKIREVQRREEAPPNGGAITPKDVHMKPFRSKGELNPNLHSRVIDRPKGPDGLPGGHADFDGGHLGLREDFVNGVTIVEVLTAFLGPKVV